MSLLSLDLANMLALFTCWAAGKFKGESIDLPSELLDGLGLAFSLSSGEGFLELLAIIGLKFAYVTLYYILTYLQNAASLKFVFK